MINKIKHLKFIYIFYISAIFVLSGTIINYAFFAESKIYIERVTKNIYVSYLDDISDNISKLILKSTKDDISTTLEKDKKLRDDLEKYLQLFVSQRYRYIYVVDIDKKSGDFRFLLDGAKDIDDKSEFKELYEPLKLAKFKEAYDKKEIITFTQKEAKGVWMTFIKPIVRDGRTDALLVVDFSMQGHQLIENSLSSLDNVLEVNIYVGALIFLIIVLFAYMDNQRAKELLSFNRRLEERVAKEVEKNRQKDQQLIQQSRLAQMGEMISMIAHQWRQPLSSISSASAAIKLKVMLGKLDKEKAIELSDNISRYSQHLSVTIDDFRDFFKSNKEKTKTNYTELLESVLGIVEISINNKNIKIEKDYNSDIIFKTYTNELKQVVLNLIKNAEDILIEREIKDPVIKIKTDGKILEICDNGGGVPEEIIAKIFDPYFSTKLDKNGTGLGLYMSKTIMEEHCEGKLDVKNKPEGACFTIVLNATTIES